MTTPNIRFSVYCYAMMLAVLNSLILCQHVCYGENELHHPKITALRWAKVGIGSIPVPPAILNDEFGVIVVENGPREFRTSAWTLGTTDSPAKMLHRSIISIPRKVVPIQDGRQVLLVGTLQLTAWNFERNRVQLVGAINPLEVIDQAPLDGEYQDVCANDTTRLIAFSDYHYGVRLASYDSIGVGRNSRFPGGRLAIMPEGDRLITISDDAVRVHPLNVEKLIVEDPTLAFRELHGTQTNEVAHAISPLELPEAFPKSRGRIFERHSCFTFDDKLAYVTFGSEFVVPRGGGKQPTELMGYETWVVTDDNRSRLVRFDERRNTQVGYPVTTLGTRSCSGKHACPHFLIVYSRGLAAVPVAFDRFQTGIPDDCFVKLPESIDGIGKIADVTSAAMNPDGTQILTGHEDGHVILWLYDV